MVIVLFEDSKFWAFAKLSSSDSVRIILSDEAFPATESSNGEKVQVWSKYFLDIVRDIRTAYAGNFSHPCCFDTEIGRLSRNVKLGVCTLWSKSAFDLIAQVWTIISFMQGLKNHCPK